MQNNPVGWFEIPVADMDRAQSFYEAVFGLKLERHELGPILMSWFPMVPEGKGASGALVKNDWYTPSAKGSLIYFTAPDIDAHLARATDAGGEVITEKKDLGEYGYSAVVQDTEGNRIGLHERKNS